MFLNPGRPASVERNTRHCPISRYRRSYPGSAVGRAVSSLEAATMLFMKGLRPAAIEYRMAKQLEFRSSLIAALVILFMIPQMGSCNAGREHPFAAKASLLRFWRRVLPDARLPPFLLEKASPLNATWMAVFKGYMNNGSLPAHIAKFCQVANLLCPAQILDADAANGSVVRATPGNSDFQSYFGKEFKGYDKSGSNSFQNYSDGQNVVKDGFKRYGTDSSGEIQDFKNYAPDTNVAEEGFGSYAGGANGAIAQFTSYGPNGNLPSQNFKSYGDNGNGGDQSFTSYGENSNVVSNRFASYGKDANGLTDSFGSYATSSNVITNNFKTYSQGGNAAVDQFSNYANDGNSATNEFQNYATEANGEVLSFATYSNGANVPQDVFKTYGKGANGPLLTFTNYGNSSNPAVDDFKEYAKDSNSPLVTFTTYGPFNTTFKDYVNGSTTFSDYSNSSRSSSVVEAGKFFRQKLLAAGSSLPLPNLRDPMPPRSFLPRSIADGLPFASRDLLRLLSTFRISDNSSMKGIMAKTLAECERAPVRGETKKCVTSVEAMAEFAVSILGSDVEVLTTSSTAGSGSTVDVGTVQPKHGGQMTRSVSCHQSLFPYLVYFCHSVPMVKVYEASLLDHKSKQKINDGVAICHMDTSQWSPKHAAFLSLGSSPGHIEICHWIFQNDLIWVPSN